MIRILVWIFKLFIKIPLPSALRTRILEEFYKNSAEIWVITGKFFQKPSFLHQLTHNMTRDSSLNSPKNTSSELLCTNIVLNVKTKNNFCTQHVVNLYFSGNSMNNLLSCCGLTDARMRASEKDLPVNVASLRWDRNVILGLRFLF